MIRGPNYLNKLKQLLVDRVEEVYPLILSNWVVGKSGAYAVGRAKHGRGELRVHLTGDKRGKIFAHRSAPDTELQGDTPYNAILHGLAGGSHGRAKRLIEDFLGVARLPVPADPIEAAKHRRRQEEEEADQRALRAMADKESAEKRERRIARLSGDFESARPVQEGDPVSAMLRGRGLFTPPPGVRFLPSYYHPELKRRFPAMIAAMTDPTSGELRSLHITFLCQDPAGAWGKLNVPHPNPSKPGEMAAAKITPGDPKGAVIELDYGSSGVPLHMLTADDKAVIAEGIEDTMTAALLYPGWRIFAAKDNDNVPAISFPKWVKRIAFVMQRDKNNPAVIKMRMKALARWESEGRDVVIVIPPPGVKDMNDALRDAVIRKGTKR